MIFGVVELQVKVGLEEKVHSSSTGYLVTIRRVERHSEREIERDTHTDFIT